MTTVQLLTRAVEVGHAYDLPTLSLCCEWCGDCTEVSSAQMRPSDLARHLERRGWTVRGLTRWTLCADCAGNEDLDIQ